MPPPSAAVRRLLSTTSAAAADEITTHFSTWFRRPTPTPIDAIFSALSSHPDNASPTLNITLSSLSHPLSTPLVLSVLRHPSPHPLLLRLRFFDWAGRHFRLPPEAYHAVFQLLSRSHLDSLLLQWLRSFSYPSPRFHEILALGYAVAGEPTRSLRSLAVMRFNGVDLSDFAYHVLVDALVEDRLYDAALDLLRRVRVRNLFTDYVLVKCFCRQDRVGEAVSVLFRTVKMGCVWEADRAVGVVVERLCELRRFEEAGRMVDEFGGACSYGVWIGNLIGRCGVDGAIEFLKSKKEEGFMPKVCSYNRLVYRLLLENRLVEVYDVFLEMREDGVVPNRGTMNAALCFFCKAGMVDVALRLYRMRSEFGLAPSGVALDHLVYALCGSDNVDEACRVLRESIDQGYIPGKQTFQFLADVLWQEGKLDKLGMLLDLALRKYTTLPADNTLWTRYVLALCKAGKTEEAYLVASQNMPGTSTTIPIRKHAYKSLIYGFIALRRGDVICKLLIEMQDHGYVPSRTLYRNVICCLCETNRLDEILTLLEVQLSLKVLNRRTCYNYLLDGLGHAKRPDLVTQMFQRMIQDAVIPNMDTKVALLQGYMKGHMISDSLKLFYELHKEREPSKRMYNMLMTGLCKAGRPDQAFRVLMEMRYKNLIPSLHCYEELVSSFCSQGNYRQAVEVLHDFQKTGRRVSPFICNVLLLHTLTNKQFWQDWFEFEMGREKQPTKIQSEHPSLGDLVAAFSGGIRLKQHLDNLDAVIEKFYPVNIYTYNMLIKGLSMAGRMDQACSLFDRLCRKGYVPNQWTFEFIVFGFCNLGMKKEAKIWMEKIYQNGFCPTRYSMKAFDRTFSSIDA